MVLKKKKKIPRILAIKNRSIGDTVLLTGPLRLLKKNFPEYQIHVLVRSPGGQLLEGLPYIDRVVSVLEPESKFERFAHWFRIIRSLREHYYHMILNFHSSFRTALTAKLLRTDRCVANHHELRGRNWFSDLPVPNRGIVKPIIDRDLDVLRALGLRVSMEDASPEIVLFSLEQSVAEKELETTEKAKKIFLGIGGGRETKRWPQIHYVSLLERILQDQESYFITSITANDEPWLMDFYSILENRPKLARRFICFKNKTLRQTAALISCCDCYIGNDSGLKHVAVALKKPTFTFFGPESPSEWHPYDPKVHPYAFIEALPCRTETGKHWCPIPVCTKYHHQCLRNLSPDLVWNDVKSVLRK